MQQTTENEIIKEVGVNKFDEIIEDIATWGKILMIKITPSFVIEIKDNMPTGSYGQGYYNFNSKNSSICGHLKVSDIEKISFVSKTTRERLSHSIVFSSCDEDIFKIFVTRDEQGNLLKEQVQRFESLRDRF